MSTELKWYGADILAKLDDKVLDGCLAAAEHLRDALIVKVSEVYPPASDPGKSPHLRTGGLQNSFEVIPILSEEGMNGYAVGSVLDRAVWLEFGTRRMLARPYFTVTTMEEMDTMSGLVSAGAGGGIPGRHKMPQAA
jgi:hypothetical protein